MTKYKMRRDGAFSGTSFANFSLSSLGLVELCISFSGLGGSLGDNSGCCKWRCFSGSRLDPGLGNRGLLDPGLANRGLVDAAELWLPSDRRFCRHEFPCMVPGMGVTMGSSLMRSDCRYSGPACPRLPLPSGNRLEEASPSFSGLASVTRSSVVSRKRVSTSEMGRRVARYVR